MKQFDGCGCRRGRHEIGIAASLGDGQAEAGSDPCAARKHGVVERIGQAWRTLWPGGPGHRLFELLLQALCDVHVSVSLCPS